MVFTFVKCQRVGLGISSVTEFGVTFVKCQRVGLGISSVSDCGVYACEVSDGKTGYR